MKIKIQLNFFSHKKLNFQPRTLELKKTFMFNANVNCSVF